MTQRTFSALGSLLLLAAAAAAEQKPFSLHLRSQVETAPRSGRYHTVVRETTWDPQKTAVVICDMWDKHWCPGATGRVGEMAPRANDVVAAIRRAGGLVIHCPSDTMDFYKDHPGRKLAQAAPKAEPKVPLQRWCSLDKAKEGSLPIDDSDGGCAEATKSFKAWSRQHEAIQIEAGDAITDSAEAYYLMRQRGVANVVVLGVHTNMCVLGRPFSIRQMVAQGMNVVLVRDLTDTMYNPAKAPFVAHCTGTDLVVGHIERHWCPSVTSVDFVGGKEFRFAEDKRPHLVVVAAEDEYKTEETLPAFALKQLGKEFRVSYVFADAKERHMLPGIEILNDADIALFSIRRRALPAAQMEIVRRFVAAGKPVVGVRTASHSFEVRKGDKPPAGCVEWPGFDREVLGCHYDGHHGAALKVMIAVAEGAEANPVLAGLKGKTFPSAGSLYKSLPLAEGATPLLVGRAGDVKPEPVAWTYRRKDGGRTFYTSLGHKDDFAGEEFAAVLREGVRWAAGLR